MGAESALLLLSTGVWICSSSVAQQARLISPELRLGTVNGDAGTYYSPCACFLRSRIRRTEGLRCATSCGEGRVSA